MGMRPDFHFTAATGWINDPHGITYRDGEYHSFFQYVPGRTDWAPHCHWGHARGTDLFSLTELPIAPGEGDGGIWTGSLVTGDDGGTGSSTPPAELDLIAIAIRSSAELGVPADHRRRRTRRDGLLGLGSGCAVRRRLRDRPRRGGHLHGGALGQVDLR
jgi:hypothetical protein